MSKSAYPDQVQLAHLRNKWRSGMMTMGEMIQFFRNSSNPLPSIDQSMTILDIPLLGVPTLALPHNDERMSFTIGPLVSLTGGAVPHLYDYSYGPPLSFFNGAVNGIRIDDSVKSTTRELSGTISVDEIWITVLGGGPPPSPCAFTIVEGQLAMRQPSWERFHP